MSPCEMYRYMESLITKRSGSSTPPAFTAERGEDVVFVLEQPGVPLFTASPVPRPPFTALGP